MSIVGKVFKKSKLGGLLILAVLLSGNIFAWFIYTTKVDGSISAHVRAWNISFEVGNTTLAQTINFDIPEIFPGMTTYVGSITAVNNGDGAAEFSYELVSATILGTTYTVGPELTSSELEEQLSSNYPFSITFESPSDLIGANGGTSTFTLNVAWAYESGDDLSDTYWGNRAYSFHDENPLNPSISVMAIITATQASA